MPFSASISTRSLSYRIAAAVFIGSLASAPLLVGGPVAAASAPVALDSQVVDSSGVLSAKEKSDLTDRAKDVLKSEQKKVYIVFVDSFDGKDPEDWAEEQFMKAPGRNVAVWAVATETRELATRAGGDFSPDQLDQFRSKTIPFLADDKWGEAAEAALDVAAGTGSSDEGGSGAWLAGGGAAVVAAGGGIWLYTRRKTKKQHKEMFSEAEKIDPKDRQKLDELPEPVLRDLAQAEIASTDAAIRAAEDELRLATNEFGHDRVRPFSQALKHSKRTLDRAFEMHKQISSSIPMTQPERQAVLVDIVSTCGQADRALEEQADAFSEMRDLLFDADSRLQELTQKTVAIRAEVPQAKSALDSLRDRYPQTSLQSIDDNVDMALEHLSHAEEAIERGRSIARKPAGQQNGLVDAIRLAETTCGQAHTLLEAILNADDEIRAAHGRIRSLIEEITQELQDAGELRNTGTLTGAQIDSSALDQAADEAWQAVQTAEKTQQDDPLGTYKLLLEADAELDRQMEAADEINRDHQHTLDLCDRYIKEAQSAIHAADDLIATRGRAVGAGARQLLNQAQQMFDEAHSLRTTDTSSAIGAARQSSTLAHQASEAAKNDIDDYRRRHSGGNGGGSFLTGMFLGSMMGGGHHYGGGFGGGGFDAGGFGGGGFGGGDFGGGSISGSF